MYIEQVTIKKIIHGGFGLCHLASGKVLLVPGGLPGEIIDAAMHTSEKNPLFGNIKRFIKPHNGRRTAPCKYYNSCGGCNLQHCDNPTQLTIKKEILHDLLLRSPEPGVRDAISLLQNPLPSPAEFGYRQRIRLQVDKQGSLGFRQFRSHTIVPVDRCIIAEEPINTSLDGLRHFADWYKLAPLATEIELLLNPKSQTVVCLIHFIRKPRPSDIATANDICNAVPSLDRIFFLGENFPIMGPYPIEEAGSGKNLRVRYDEAGSHSPPLHLQWEAGGFCQVNLRQNNHLIDVVEKFCQISKEETILDLYCGMGNFSILLGRKAKSVTGIEGQGASIRCAKLNAQNDGLTNTRFIKSPIDSGCRNLLKNDELFDCVVLDPPRQGIPGLAPDLAKLTGKRLIYISCDPATLCRDLADLLRIGFSIKTIQPLDMFPQTHHIETVVLLEKTAAS